MRRAKLILAVAAATVVMMVAAAPAMADVDIGGISVDGPNLGGLSIGSGLSNGSGTNFSGGVLGGVGTGVFNVGSGGNVDVD